IKIEKKLKIIRKNYDFLCKGHGGDCSSVNYVFGNLYMMLSDENKEKQEECIKKADNLFKKIAPEEDVDIMSAQIKIKKMNISSGERIESTQKKGSNRSRKVVPRIDLNQQANKGHVEIFRSIICNTNNEFISRMKSLSNHVD